MTTNQTQVHIFSDAVRAEVSSNCIDAQVVIETVTQSILGVPGPDGSPGPQGPQGLEGNGSSDSLSDADGDTGITVEAGVDEDKIRFDTAGTERMVLDASGKLGVGTDPSQKLHVNGNIQITERNRLQIAHSGFRNALVYMAGTELRLFTDTGGSSIGFYIGTGLTAKIVPDGITFAGGSKFLRTNNSSDSLTIQGNSGLTMSTSYAGGTGDIIFLQKTLQVAKIDPDGNFGIGLANQFGGGKGVFALADTATPPTATPTGGGIIYVEGGALKYRGSSGTVTTIAAA